MSNTITPTVFYRTLNLEGLEIFSREAGPRDAPTVLLLHGFPSRFSIFSTGKLRCKFAKARFAGLVPGRYFTNHLKTFIP
jgi:pimeloyl-ACP methyl ester carboxylesterase